MRKVFVVKLNKPESVLFNIYTIQKYFKSKLSRQLYIEVIVCIPDLHILLKNFSFKAFINKANSQHH